MKNLLTLFIALAITSCGFQPLYKKEDVSSESYSACNNFKVYTTDLNVIGQIFRVKLQDDLNSLCLNKDVDYIVEVFLEEDEEALGIQRDREITRYNAILKSDFRLLHNDKSVYSGKNRLVGGYNAVESDFGTYSQKDDTLKKLAEEMAAEITLKLSSFLKNKK